MRSARRLLLVAVTVVVTFVTLLPSQLSCSGSKPGTVTATSQATIQSIGRDVRAIKESIDAMAVNQSNQAAALADIQRAVTDMNNRLRAIESKLGK